jgi:archaellum biogenesis ATPase FlaH
LSSDTSYDKIKHLVEIEDDIFAVFTIDSRGDANDLTVAKNIDSENSLIENIFTNFNRILKQDDKIIDILTNNNRSSDILGRLKWKVTEYEKIRILQIADKNKIVVVLIKSSTTLDETVDNILGYYYEEEEEDIPKSLF